MCCCLIIFEDILATEDNKITDADLDEALRAFLHPSPHAVKVIITTRRPLHQDFATLGFGLQRRIDLDNGLESPYAENILRDMDKEHGSHLGLHTLSADDPLLKTARERTRGFPRAIEALFALLSSDRSTTLAEVLADMETVLPEHIVEVVVGGAFNRLAPALQQVIQTLAIFGRPVPAVAVDYLLQPFNPSIDSTPSPAPFGEYALCSQRIRRLLPTPR